MDENILETEEELLAQFKKQEEEQLGICIPAGIVHHAILELGLNIPRRVY